MGTSTALGGIGPLSTRLAGAESLTVLSARVVGEQLDPGSMVELTGEVKNNCLQWKVPDATWRLMAYRLKFATIERFLKGE
ncbi:MAG: hypothetical protein ACP5M4_15520 [Acidobacteriaceae bacterium]